MKPNSFAVLAAVTVVALVLAISTYASQTRLAQIRSTGEPLLPGLTAQASRIARIELQQGDKKIALARDQNAWSLADRAGYPVKVEPVRALLNGLVQAELVEAKTRSKERYALLELEDPAAKDAKSNLVRMLDDKGGVLAEAVIGKKRSDAFGATRGGTYVRRPGETQTWLANAELNVPMAVRDWVQPSLIDIPVSKITALSIEIPGEEPLKVARDAADASKHVLAGMPEDKKLKDASVAANLARAAGSLDLEDVRKADAADAGAAGTAKIEADGGLAVTVKLRKDGDSYWAVIDATGADGEAKKSADEIMGRVRGWQYKIPASKAEAILKRRADLFEAS